MKFRQLLPSLLVCVFSSASLLAAPSSVKASAFGFNVEDATECLQKAIASGAKTVIVDNVGKDWIIRPVKLRDDLEFVLEDNVVIMAKADEFKGRNDSLLSCIGMKNITIRGGKNSVLRMRKKDYLDASRYAPAEWRHGINASGVEGFVLKDLLIQSTGGDGLYLGCNGKVACNQVLVENVVFDDNNRMGLTVIGSNNTLVRHCVMKNTYGASPQAGIGIEPNNIYGTMTNLVFEDCDCFGNAWIGGYLHNWSLDPEKTPPISVTFRNCNFHDNKVGGFSVYGVKAGPGRRVVHGTADFIGCNFTADGGHAICLSNLTMDGFKVSFKDCTASATKTGLDAVKLHTEMLEPYGNVDFGNLSINVEEGCPAIRPSAMSLVGIGGLFGAPKVSVGNGPAQPYDLAALVAKYPPKSNVDELTHMTIFDPSNYKAGGDKGVKAGASYRLRGANRFVQCVKQGEMARVHCRIVPLAERFKVTQPQKIEIVDRTNTHYKTLSIGTEEQVIELPAHNGDQVYVFKFSGFHPFNVWSETAGNGLVAQNMKLISSPSTWYFQVPAKLETIRIMLNVTELETAHAVIYDAEGKVRLPARKYDEPSILEVRRTPTAKPETWCLKFPKVVEDYEFTFLGDLDPIVFAAPENIIVRK